MPQELKKLGDLFGQDLAGWQIAMAYFLELEHGLMGMFPAITTKDEVPILVLKKSDLRFVWDRLRIRPAKTTSMMVVVNTENGYAFSLEAHGKDAKLIHVFSREELESRSEESRRKEENPFRWAPGLLQVSSVAVSRTPDFKD